MLAGPPLYAPNRYPDIPGFRDALFRTLASRLRTAEARLAAALEAPDRGRHRGKVTTPRL